MHAGIDPLLDASRATSADGTRRLLDRCFGDFLKERNRVWPPLLEYMKENWLKLFPLLREISGLIRMERMKVPVPDVEEDTAGARALMRLAFALRSYELTLHLMLSSMPRLIAELATEGTPKELEDPKDVIALLDRIDVATAVLEFGTIASIRMLERPGSLNSPAFEGATEYAARGADEQHVVIRGVLRSVIGEAAVARRESIAEGGDEPGPPPEALLAEWVRAVLAV